MSVKLEQMEFAVAIKSGADGEPPKEFRLLAKGINPTLKGDILFDDQAAKLVPAAYAEHGVGLFFDYEHKSVRETLAVDGGKAAGWFKPDVREGELWATEIDWTPAGDSAIRNKEYRYFSPVILRDLKNGRAHKLVNVALTNLPAMKNLRALVASELPITPEKTMEPSETEVALFAALQTDSLSKALGVIAALREEAGKVTTLSVRVAELEKQIATRDVDKLLLDAKEAGKVSEAELPKLREQGVKDVEWLSGYLAVKTPAPAATPEHKEPNGEPSGGDKLTKLELRAIELSGVTTEEFLKEKTRLAALDARDRQRAQEAY